MGLKPLTFDFWVTCLLLWPTTVFSLFICRKYSQDKPRRINEREESADFRYPRHSDDRYSGSRDLPFHRGRGRGRGYERGNGRGYERQLDYERGRSYGRGRGPPDRGVNYLPRNPVDNRSLIPPVDNRSLMNFSGVLDNTSTEAKMKFIVEQSRTQEQLYSKLHATAALTNVSPFGTVNHASASVQPSLLGDHPDSHIRGSKRKRSNEGSFPETTIENRKSLKEFTIPRKVSRNLSGEQSESQTEDRKTNSDGTKLGKDSQRTDEKASNQQENQQIIQASMMLASDLQSKEKFGTSLLGSSLHSDLKQQSHGQRNPTLENCSSSSSIVPNLLDLDLKDINKVSPVDPFIIDPSHRTTKLSESEPVIRPLLGDLERQSTLLRPVVPASAEGFIGVPIRPQNRFRPPWPLLTNESNMRYFRQRMPNMPENFMVGNRGPRPSRWLPPNQSNQRGRFPPPRGYLLRPQAPQWNSHNMEVVSLIFVITSMHL